jgi:predicted dehydrogenase
MPLLYLTLVLQCATKVGRVTFEIVGSKGTLRIYDERSVEFIDENGVTTSREDFAAKVKASSFYSEFEDVEGEFDNFYNVLRNGKPIGVTPSQAYQHFAFFACAIESAQTGKPVDIPSV